MGGAAEVLGITPSKCILREMPVTQGMAQFVFSGQRCPVLQFTVALTIPAG